jgi:hypothetical protein
MFSGDAYYVVLIRRTTEQTNLVLQVIDPASPSAYEMESWGQGIYHRHGLESC